MTNISFEKVTLKISKLSQSMVVTRLREERKYFARFSLFQLKTCQIGIMPYLCKILDITVSNVIRIIQSDNVSSKILVTQCLLNVNLRFSVSWER